MRGEADLNATVAYFSMEIALEAAVPTYSGGLGVLAGDTLRAAADLGVPMVAVSLLHRKGYFRQRVDAAGNQTEAPALWDPATYLTPMAPRTTIVLAGREVTIRAWRYLIGGNSPRPVPVYLLDTDLPENTDDDRALTGQLYGGDQHYRLCQEVILGMGGVRMLRSLGYHGLRLFHMNEGHSALLTLALLEEQTWGRERRPLDPATRSAVRRQCVFTTHTPVSAGHDQFPLELLASVVGEDRANLLDEADGLHDGSLNMTHLALSFSHYVNGVAMRHGETSRTMFPEVPVNAITNGVHARTWISEPLARLYDRYIPEWRRDNLYLRYAIGIPLEEIWQTHVEAREMLFTEVVKRTGIRLRDDALTIGFARRATAYKRAGLLFSDPLRLRRISRAAGPLQVIYAGKAHPQDESGKTLIRSIFQAAAALKGDIDVVYLEDYDMALARLLCAGVDLWLNTPQKPLEASGTSGMKAALNGVPSLSVLDGWWVEGCIEGVTGWSIGESADPASDPGADAAWLYDKLERVVLPTFHRHRPDYARVMRFAVAVNGSFFNAQRMVLQYQRHAYDIPDIALGE